jgi:hypothetical protein
MLRRWSSSQLLCPIQREKASPRSQTPVVLAQSGVVSSSEPGMRQPVEHDTFPPVSLERLSQGQGCRDSPFPRNLNGNAPATPSADRQNYRGAQTALAGQSERFDTGSGPTKRALLISNVGVPHREEGHGPTPSLLRPVPRSKGVLKYLRPHSQTRIRPCKSS